jgi:hypothetical protein
VINSERLSGMHSIARRVLPISVENKDLHSAGVSGAERQRAGTPSVNPLVARLRSAHCTRDGQEIRMAFHQGCRAKRSLVGGSGPAHWALHNPRSFATFSIAHDRGRAGGPWPPCDSSGCSAQKRATSALGFFPVVEVTHFDLRCRPDL